MNPPAPIQTSERGDSHPSLRFHAYAPEQCFSIARPLDIKSAVLEARACRKILGTKKKEHIERESLTVLDVRRERAKDKARVYLQRYGRQISLGRRMQS